MVWKREVVCLRHERNCLQERELDEQKRGSDVEIVVLGEMYRSCEKESL